MSITGELLDYTNDQYVVASQIGNLTIASEMVVCLGEACPSLLPKYSEFTISGSRNLALKLMPTLLDGFSASLGLDVTQQSDENGNPQVLFSAENGEDIAKITFAMLGSSAGLRDLLNGGASLALTTRVARPSEVSAFSSAGFGNIRSVENELVLALDGIVVVTSSQNRVHIIRDSDVAAIFSGRIDDWAQLGGVPGPINLYVRPENSGTGAVFSQLVMRPARTGFSLRVNLMDSDIAVADAVAADPNGIGFTAFSDRANAAAVSLLGVCNIQSPATDFTIQSEEYPFSRRLYLYKGSRDVPPLVEQFVEYLNTADAQELVGLTGFVSQAVREVPVNDQGLRFLSAALPTDAEMTLESLQAMMTDFATASRVSITYRFEQGTVQLDSRAQADINRLVGHMLSPQLRTKTIILVGFTDSVGNGENNQRLSVTRAEQVRTALLAAGAGAIDPSRIVVRGYGELSPLGCNEATDGRRINRRVEVWAR
ncbi:MAG: substrate-binding domain-containing protein [Rhodobacteraceae bacterium]|nr:substrate-binding domain-containing protein [Paracoccaceae bacterium]